MNIRVLVCNDCLDVPQTQLRAIVVPADPVPILNPRVQNYVDSEANYRYTQGNTIDPQTGIPVIGGDMRETNPTGLPIYQTGELMLEGDIFYLTQEDGYYILLEEVSGFLPVATYIRVTQQTGEPYGGLNEQPGTDPNAPGNSNPGLPYDNVVVPYTGPE